MGDKCSFVSWMPGEAVWSNRMLFLSLHLGLPCFKKTNIGFSSSFYPICSAPLPWLPWRGFHTVGNSKVIVRCMLKYRSPSTVAKVSVAGTGCAVHKRTLFPLVNHRAVSSQRVPAACVQMKWWSPFHLTSSSLGFGVGKKLLLLNRLQS